MCLQAARAKRVTYLQLLLNQLQVLQRLKKLQHLKSMDCRDSGEETVFEPGPVIPYGSFSAFEGCHIIAYGRDVKLAGIDRSHVESNRDKLLACIHEHVGSQAI